MHIRGDSYGTVVRFQPRSFNPPIANRLPILQPDDSYGRFSASMAMKMAETGNSMAKLVEKTCWNHLECKFGSIQCCYNLFQTSFPVSLLNRYFFRLLEKATPSEVLLRGISVIPLGLAYLY